MVHDHDPGYGAPVGAMCVDAMRDRGLSARSRPVWDHDESPADDLGDAEAVLYAGVAGSGAERLWHDLHSANPTFDQRIDHVFARNQMPVVSTDLLGEALADKTPPSPAAPAGLWPSDHAGVLVRLQAP